jgi:putative phosphoribosyl transferase
VVRQEIRIDAGAARLTGDLEVPAEARGIVLFAHGSGSSRLSSRNRRVAAALHDVGLGTMLFDLLTEGEAADRANVFDVGLLAGRLKAATQRVRAEAGLDQLPLGYFGASTGAAAALWAAAEPDMAVAAVVSRGGRPDLAVPKIAEVIAPTLLIVGSLDHTVLELNRSALGLLRPPSRLAVVDGATHLFEEPGALDQVASLARGWFLTWLTPTKSSR